MILFAHRGASDFAPENTLAAFSEALAMGAEAIELDVQLTADCRLIVGHDYDLLRVTGQIGLVGQKTYDELKMLDAGAWYDKRFVNQRLPLLSEVLDIVPTTVCLNIEIKQMASDYRPIERYLFELLDSRGRLANTIVSSFNHVRLGAFQALVDRAGQECRLGLLLAENLIRPVDYVKASGLKLTSIHPAVDMVSQVFVDEMHDNGWQVYVYTVNNRWVAEQLEEMGVDGIFVNNLKI